MAELTLALPSIRNMKICSFKGQLYTVSKLELIALSISNKEKQLVKSYDGTCELLYVGTNGTRMFIVFKDYYDIYDQKTVKTIPFDFSEATAFGISNNKLVVTTNTVIFSICCETFNVTKYSYAVAVDIVCATYINEYTLILGDVKGYLTIFDCKREQEILRQKIHNDSIQDIAWVSDYLITASRDKIIRKNLIRVDDVPSITLIGMSVQFNHFINCINVRSFIIAGLSNGELVVLDINSLKTISKKMVHSDSVRSVCELQKNAFATISDDNSCTVIYIEPTTGAKIKLQKNFLKRTPKIKCASFNGGILCTGTSDGKINILDLTHKSQREFFLGKDIRSICFISSQRIVVGYENGSLHYLRQNDSQILNRGTTPYSIIFLEREEMMFVGRRDGTIEKYCYCKVADRFTLIIKKHLHLSIVGDIKYNNGYLYSCSDDQTMLVHDLALHRIHLVKPSENCTALNNILFSRTMCYVSSDNGNVYLIDASTQMSRFEISKYPIRAIEAYYDAIILGDRRGALIRLDRNLQNSLFYQGNSRVISISEYDARLYVVFEDAIINFERIDIETMAKGTVFIIHGHDSGLKNAVQLLLSRAGVSSIVLHEMPDRGRTIIDKLIEESNACRFAIALLTSDDLTADGKYHARQNVYVEIGYFFGKLGKDHVLMLKDTAVDIPSDLNGILYTPVVSLDDASWRIKILKELSEVGFSINISEILKTI